MSTPQPTAAELIRMHTELPGLKRMLRDLAQEIQRIELVLNHEPLLLEGEVSEVVSHSFPPEASPEQRAAFGVQEPEPKTKKTGSASKNYWAKMTPAQRRAEMKRRQQVHARKLRRGG